MLVQGDYYRDLSDNRKVKEVDEIASRGNIYDRNGKVLATSIPSFAVQLYKDQLTSLDDEKKVANISRLVDILEEDGVNYTEDYLSLIHISEPTRQCCTSRMPSSA